MRTISTLLLILIVLHGSPQGWGADSASSCSSHFANTANLVVTLPRNYKPAIQELRREEISNWEDISKKVGGQFHDSISTGTILVDGKPKKVIVKQVSVKKLGPKDEITLLNLQKEAHHAQMLSDLKIGPEFYGVVKEKKKSASTGALGEDSWLFVSEWIEDAELVRYPGALAAKWDQIGLQTAQDLERIAKTFAINGVLPSDFQYMLKSDGRVVVIDAEKYIVGSSPATDYKYHLRSMEKIYLSHEDLVMSQSRRDAILKQAGLDQSPLADDLIRILQKAEWYGTRKGYSVSPSLFFNTFLTDVKNLQIKAGKQKLAHLITERNPGEEEKLYSFWTDFFHKINSPLTYSLLEIELPLAQRLNGTVTKQQFQSLSAQAKKNLGVSLAKKDGFFSSSEELTSFGTAASLYPELVGALRKNLSASTKLSESSLKKVRGHRRVEDESIINSTLPLDSEILRRHRNQIPSKLTPKEEASLKRRIQELEKMGAGNRQYQEALALEYGIVDEIALLPPHKRRRIFMALRDFHQIFSQENKKNGAQVIAFEKALLEANGVSPEGAEIGIRLGIFSPPFHGIFIKDILSEYRRSQDIFRHLKSL